MFFQLVDHYQKNSIRHLCYKQTIFITLQPQKKLQKYRSLQYPANFYKMFSSG